MISNRGFEAVLSKQITQSTLDEFWESAYKDGLRVKYPYDSIVSFVFHHRPRNIPHEETFILEVGCGTGNNQLFLANEGFQAHGIDGSESAINFANEYLGSKNLKSNLRVGDFVSLDYPSDYFHLVIDRGSLTCTNMKGIQKALEQIHRVMKIGGKFYFNPYSDRSSSFAAGETGEDGATRNITGGFLRNTGQILFLGKKQVIGLLGKKWKILSLRHLSFSEELKSDYQVHAEWEVVAEKIG